MIISVCINDISGSLEFFVSDNGVVLPINSLQFANHFPNSSFITLPAFDLNLLVNQRN